FIWTLSTNVCPDYSSDTVMLNRAPIVTANPDFLELGADEVMGEISLIANDVTGGAGFEISIVSPPAFGTIDTAALALGNLSYMVNLLEFGETELTYEICSTECPDLCSTALVSITIAPRDDSFVPNTITPNDDGANDQLVFDVLLFNSAEEFPDNELIIFNRWGDIIYEAKPYNNDWNGLSGDGTPVPEATYYYILRLDIGRGEIIRGDITVIR
ncbi:MAG: gliding motility-associated C-terminal domain-containing protein, partial [Bacteroidota bacterium]